MAGGDLEVSIPITSRSLGTVLVPTDNTFPIVMTTFSTYNT